MTDETVTTHKVDVTIPDEELQNFTSADYEDLLAAKDEVIEDLLKQTRILGGDLVGAHRELDDLRELVVRQDARIKNLRNAMKQIAVQRDQFRSLEHWAEVRHQIESVFGQRPLDVHITDSDVLSWLVDALIEYRHNRSRFVASEAHETDAQDGQEQGQEQR